MPVSSIQVISTYDPIRSGVILDKKNVRSNQIVGPGEVLVVQQDNKFDILRGKLVPGEPVLPGRISVLDPVQTLE